MCGSLLFSVVRDGAYVHVAMGSLVDAPGIRPTEHIFVGSKAPWFDITDEAAQSSVPRQQAAGVRQAKKDVTRASFKQLWRSGRTRTRDLRRDRPAF